jgi:hypothetical protein
MADRMTAVGQNQSFNARHKRRRDDANEGAQY